MSAALSKMASPTTVHVCMYVCPQLMHGDDQTGGGWGKNVNGTWSQGWTALDNYFIQRFWRR